MSPCRARLACATAFLALAGCHFDGIAGANGDWKPGTEAHDVTVGDLTRRFLVHVPAKRPMTTAGAIRPYSLVIVLHGSSGSADEIRQTTGMDSLSESRRFLVAYPEGVRGAGGLFPSDWNAGTCCGAAARENIDDVGFIATLIEDVGRHMAIDRRRIYVAGFSDGGRMAHHLACKLSPTVAAIAVVSGSLKDDSCTPGKPVPILAIHGTSDVEVPFDDPSMTPPPAPVFGTAATLPPSIQFWVAENGCAASAQAQPTADVVLTTFSGCTGAEVVFYAIEGGSHAWPGDVGGAGAQPPMSEVRASQVIAQFFARQVRR